MSEDMSIGSYLAAGGKLSSPDNVPPRYRAELMRLMATFIDSELAGSAGFADSINDAPGIKERIAATRITMEKTVHAEKIMDVMATFGANMAKYATHLPWEKRLERNSDIGATRSLGDMRLSVFHYPLTGWQDAVVMNVLQGFAAEIQLAEFAKISYQPLGEVFVDITATEVRHKELGIEGLKKIAEDADNKAAAQASIDYWMPRVAAGFGSMQSSRFDSLKAYGIRHATNEDMKAEWEKQVKTVLAETGF